MIVIKLVNLKIFNTPVTPKTHCGLAPLLKRASDSFAFDHNKTVFFCHWIQRIGWQKEWWTEGECVLNVLTYCMSSVLCRTRAIHNGAQNPFFKSRSNFHSATISKNIYQFNLKSKGCFFPKTNYTKRLSYRSKT